MTWLMLLMTDEVSSWSNDDNPVQSDAASKTGDDDDMTAPPFYIQHPNQSRFYSFSFVVAKSIMEVMMSLLIW